MYRPPVFTVLNDSEFELVEPFSYEWMMDDSIYPHRIVIPKGFVTDGASIPRWLWSLSGLQQTGVHFGAAVVHDRLYQCRGRLIEGEYQRKVLLDWEAHPLEWDRKQCDEMFLRIMRDAGATAWKRQVMYRAVRVFGGAAWNR